MNTTTITESAPVSAPVTRAKRIRRKPVAIDAATAPRLTECLKTGQFVGIKAEKKDGTPRTYCAHKPYFRHLSGNRSAAEVVGTGKARSEAQKAQIVFSEANLDGIRSIAGSSRVFRITHNGKTWTLNQSEYERQRAEFARQNAEPIESVVQSALAETLESGDFPVDFTALL